MRDVATLRRSEGARSKTLASGAASASRCSVESVPTEKRTSPRSPILSQAFRVSVLLLSCGLPTIAQSAEPPSFDRDIAPLLVRRCLDCHNGTEKKGGLDLSRADSATKGGESGAVLVSGKPKESLLWQHVRDGEMPPKKPLPSAEVELLQKWIDAGAKWGKSPIDPFAFTTETRAGHDWWSLQPVRRAEPPPVVPEFAAANPQGDEHPIDRFVRSRVKAESLSPSPPAERRVLLRRLSFDLLGLPPTPEEVAEFERDPAPNAFDRAVDRLLESPHFGERWARHWLDIIRFGESQGFERDKLRTNSWRYRDWVASAFQKDMPYDEFVRLQVAGDVHKPNDPESLIATGFWVAGAYDEVGQSQQSAAMKAVVRQDEIEDYVSTIGETFLGLTVHCARCHDHKFDPILARDYYRLSAALGGVRHGERELPANNDAFISHRQHQVEQLQRESSVLAKKLEELESEARHTILAERRARITNSKKNPPPSPIARWDFNEDLKDAIGDLHATANGAKLQDGRVKLSGRETSFATAPLKKDLTAKTLEVWVQLDQRQQAGGGAISIQTLDGVTFDAIVFGEREPNRWLAGSNGYARTQSFQGSEETDADKQLIHFAIVYAADGVITGYRNGQLYGQPYKSSGPITFEANKSQVIFGLRHSPPGGNRHLAGSLDRAALYDRALSAEEVATSAGVFTEAISDAELVARLPVAAQAERSRLKFELDHLHRQLARANENKVYAVAPRAPEVTHLLLRGNPASLGEELAAGSPAAFANHAVVEKSGENASRESDVSTGFNLPKEATDADRRVALAEWLTDRRNPLLARVIVNRLWHYHFGVGLVDSPSDFGFNGGRPSHPELLDWLAAELMQPSVKLVSTQPAPRPWSLKHIHRLIVTSATYRQSSRARADAVARDAGNRLLWRKSPMRLDAETVRDAVLAMSGELNPTVGGPGYHDFTTFTFNSQFYDIVDPVGASFHRRSLYRTWVRSGRNPFLEVLDCPDPSTKTPRRAVTTTPLQALSLLNNSFMLRMSDRLAERLKRDAGDDLSKAIERCWQLAYSRSPTEAESASLQKFAHEHGLAALTRLVFNSNEFLYVE